MNKKSFLFFVLSLFSLFANADSVEINGIYYNLFSDTKTAEVTQNPNGYSGDIVIPSNIIFEGDSYTVTSFKDRAFRYCYGLTAISIPNTITSIKEYCFTRCTSLKSITIPSNLVSIDKTAFYQCDLEQITVEKGNTMYDSRNNCNAIIETADNSIYIGCKNTIIPNDIKAIGDHSFDQCFNLTSIVIPENVLLIGRAAFQTCNQLETIVIPDHVRLIGEYAFNQCSSLKTITLPADLQSLSDEAFNRCDEIIRITSRIRSPFELSENVFTSNVHKNAVLNVPQGKKNIYQSLSYWNKFSQIEETAMDEGDVVNTKLTLHVEKAGTLPELLSEENLIYVEELTLTGELNGTDFRVLREMAGCNYLGNDSYGNLKVLDFSGAKVVAGGEKYVDTDHLPGYGGNFRYTVENDNVLPAHVFHGCKLKSVVISNSVTCIEKYAFNNCRYLSSVTIPNTVTIIDNYVFRSCINLASIAIPNSVVKIGDEVFNYCNGLSSITIPNSVESIGANIILDCDKLSTVIVESGNSKYDSRNDCNAIIETASNTLLAGCKNSTIPNTVTSIGNNAFSVCRNLTSITIPNSVTSIGSWAFNFCDELTSITIPNSVTSIGEYAFRCCESLTSITIPKSVTTIGKKAFVQCSGLTTIKVESGNAKYDSRNDCNAIIETESNTLIKGCVNTIIPNAIQIIGVSAFESCNSLTSITIPNSVTSINDNAFYMSGLTSIIIPNSVTAIGSNVFCYCDFTTIKIPSSISVIGNNAFADCRKLSHVISEIVNPFAINGNVFSSGIYSTATLTVPKGTKDAYLATDGWNKFTNIKESNTTQNIAEAIDLGLTSGTLWASCNIGASSPEEYGDYFAWGETAPKSNYDWSTYKFGNESNFTKYNSTDGLTQLELEDDAAYVIWGKGWRMPTHEEEIELANECTWEDVEVNGISGYRITGPNGNSIFMPRGGIYDGTDYDCDGTKLSWINKYGWYWSSTLNSIGSSYAQGLCSFPSLSTNVGDHERCDGHNIRPVYVGEKETVGKVANVVDLGLSVKWASWNVGAEAPEDKGNHYAWGELSPKTDYSTSTYKFYDNGYTKYGSIDQKYRLDSEDDVAKQLWGDNWRIPTYEELKELKEKCTFTKTEINGIPVTKVEGPNGNFIYFPYPGNYTDKTICFENSVGSYWSSDLGSDDYSKDLDFENGTVSLNGDYRYHGQSIRPVYMDMYTDISTLTDAVYANMATGHKGGDGTLIINLKNSQATNAYSFDLLLPEGVTLAKNNKGEFIYNMSVRHKEHSGTINYNETTGMYSIAVLSLASNEVKGNDGEIFTMKLQIADNVEVGNYPVKIQNAKYSLISGSTSVYMPETTGRLEIDSYIKGDPNGDKSVDIADAVCIVNHIVGKATPSFIEKAADANGDGVVDIADAVRIVNLIVGKINALARQRYVSLPEPE